MQPNKTPIPDIWRAAGPGVGSWLLIALALLLLASSCRDEGERPMWPCDFSCWPAKCQPWCGTPPGVPVREGTPAPFVTPLGDL